MAQRGFKSLFAKSTTEERKILCLMAECEETILSYSHIKENTNLNSEPSALLKSLINKKHDNQTIKRQIQIKKQSFQIIPVNSTYKSGYWIIGYG